MRKNIYERRSDLERQKIALLGKEKALQEKERKERTRKLIELGGLVAKAKLDHLDTKTLYGALLSLQPQVGNTTTIAQWLKQGQAAFTTQNIVDNAVPIIVQFPEKPSDEARAALRALGLRWNSIRQEWQGITQAEPVQITAKQFGGKVTVMKS
jgi:hypothetical protein